MKFLFSFFSYHKFLHIHFATFLQVFYDTFLYIVYILYDLYYALLLWLRSLPPKLLIAHVHTRDQLNQFQFQFQFQFSAFTTALIECQAIYECSSYKRG